jgi:hypothetical protein
MRKYTFIGNKYSALLPHAISLGTLEDFCHMLGPRDILTEHNVCYRYFVDAIVAMCETHYICFTSG